MIKQIDHIEIIVNDVNEHVEFYKKLGFEVIEWTEHHGGSAEIKLPGENQPIIELHTVIDEENIGINHIAFRADDIEETYEELRGKGIEFNTEPYRNRRTGRSNVRLRDPDGWRLQICDKERQEPAKGIDDDSVVEEL